MNGVSAFFWCLQKKPMKKNFWNSSSFFFLILSPIFPYSIVLTLIICRIFPGEKSATKQAINRTDSANTVWYSELSLFDPSVKPFSVFPDGNQIYSNLYSDSRLYDSSNSNSVHDSMSDQGKFKLKMSYVLIPSCYMSRNGSKMFLFFWSLAVAGIIYKFPNSWNGQAALI